MSTTKTIKCTRDTYINSSSGNFDSSTSLYMNCTSQDPSTRTITAFLQFELPAELKYKKITSAVVNFSYTMTINGSGAGDNLISFYYAPFSASTSIAGITNNNISNYGIIGSTNTDTVRYTISAGSYSSSKSFNVTSLLQNNTYNNLFTLTVTAHSLLSSVSKTIASTENTSGYPTLVITYEDILPSADTPIYPLDVYLNQSDPITFRWKFNSESQITQASYTLAYKKRSDSTYITLVTGGTELKYSVPANMFPIGEIDWSIVSTDILGSITPIAYGRFTVVGKPSAPNITSVKNDALTTISWNSADQSARELQLLKAGMVIASENVSSPSTQYSPTLFLKNGTYEFKIRILNNFGYWSDWTSYIFTLSVTVPTAPEISCFVDNDNIVLDVLNDSGQTFLYRVEDGVETLIAEIPDNTYIDKTMKFNTSVKYFARSYNNGISDSEIISVYVVIDGFALSANGETLRFRLSEDQFLPLGESLSVNKTLTYYDGRKLPVLESGEHISHGIERKFFVPNNDWNMFKRFLLSEIPILYRDSLGNKMFCTITGQSSEYREIIGGKVVPLSLTEVYYDEAVTIDG